MTLLGTALVAAGLALLALLVLFYLLVLAIARRTTRQPRRPQRWPGRSNVSSIQPSERLFR
jgi:hypothetical protein